MQALRLYGRFTFYTTQITPLDNVNYENCMGINAPLQPQTMRGGGGGGGGGFHFKLTIFHVGRASILKFSKWKY